MSLENSLDFYRYKEQAYDLCGKNSLQLGLHDDAVAYAMKYFDLLNAKYESEPTVENLHNLSVAYGRIGDAYYAIGDLISAETWYRKALDVDIQVDKKLQSIDSAFSLSVSNLVLGDIYMRNRKYENADQYYTQAVCLRKKILSADNSDKCQREYGETLLARGSSLLLKGDIKKAYELFTEAKEIMIAIAKEYGTIESHHACSVALNR
jgi:tetratricopeptide (TPR) repeat protein